MASKTSLPSSQQTSFLIKRIVTSKHNTAIFPAEHGTVSRVVRVVSESLRPRGPRWARLLWPSRSPRACSNSPASRLIHVHISCFSTQLLHSRQVQFKQTHTSTSSLPPLRPSRFPSLHSSQGEAGASSPPFVPSTRRSTPHAIVVTGK